MHNLQGSERLGLAPEPSLTQGWPSTDLEGQRQSALLGALWGAELPAGLQPLPGPQTEATLADGLQAYQRNGQASAWRALQSAYPVIRQLLGDEALRALARDLWQRSPPSCGDLGLWGADLADYLPQVSELAGEPYLPDVARLEWAVHGLMRAADAPPPGPPEGLALLASHDPDGLWLQWRPGSAVICSAWPVLSLWRAHQPDHAAQPQPFERVRQALADGEGESLLAWRPGWRPQLTRLNDDQAAFSAALLAGASLGQALAQHPVDFSDWLVQALRAGWLLAVQTNPLPLSQPSTPARGLQPAAFLWA